MSTTKHTWNYPGSLRHGLSKHLCQVLSRGCNFKEPLRWETVVPQTIRVQMETHRGSRSGGPGTGTGPSPPRPEGKNVHCSTLSTGPPQPHLMVS